MNTPDSLRLAATTIAGTLVLVGVILGIALFVVRRLAQTRTAETRTRYPNARFVISNASFFGQESHGVRQMRGNGTLVLTDTEMVFEMWLPQSRYTIPLRAIQTIETPRSFLGKSRFTPLLKVVFQNEAGQIDAMAWQVSDLDAAVHALEELRR